MTGSPYEENVGKTICSPLDRVASGFKHKQQTPPAVGEGCLMGTSVKQELQDSALEAKTGHPQGTAWVFQDVLLAWLSLGRAAGLGNGEKSPSRGSAFAKRSG